MYVGCTMEQRQRMLRPLTNLRPAHKLLQQNGNIAGLYTDTIWRVAPVLMKSGGKVWCGLPAKS